MARKNLISFGNDDADGSTSANLGTAGAPAPNPVGELQAEAAAAITGDRPLADRPLADRPLASRPLADRPLASNVASEQIAVLPTKLPSLKTSPLRAMKEAVDSVGRVEQLEEQLR